jgi:glycosyltransferase involved in cell wall biosynthesis
MHITQSQPLVSVLIPVYNAGDFLRPAILSIVHQTYQNLEIIIIDDGSTDSCISTNEALIRSDTRIKYIRQNNTGRPGALNHGLEIVHGDFWMIEDADDISYPQRVEKQVTALINNPQLAAVFCKNDIILPDGRSFAPGCMGIDSNTCKSLIEKGCVPAHDATGMYRTEMVSDFHFDKDMWLIEGIDFVIRIGEKFPIAVIPDCLYSHRVNYSSITHSQADKISETTDRFKRKMASRRGDLINVAEDNKQQQSKSLFSHRKFDTVLPYAMESVYEHRQCRKWMEAFKTALICLRLHPLDWFYYKPLVYCFSPMSIIRRYRNWKSTN